MGTGIKLLVKSNWILICIMILSIFLNIYNLEKYPLNPDEVVYTAQSAIWAGHNEYSKNFIPYSRSATNFQMYQLMTGLFLKIFGISEFVARFPTAIMGILLVPAIYFLAEALFNRRTALFSAFFMSTNAYILHFNRQIHLDTPIVFFMVLSILFLVKWHDARIDEDKIEKSGDKEESGSRKEIKKKDIYFYLFLISTILATMIKVIIIVPLVVLILYYLYMKKDLYNTIKMLARPISILMMLIALLYAAYFIVYIVGIDEYRETFSFAVNRESENPTSYINVMIEFFGILSIITVLGLIYSLRNGISGINGKNTEKYIERGIEKYIEKSTENILIVIWFLFILIFFSIYPLQEYSYILPIVPSIVLLNGIALDSLLSRTKRPKFFIVIILILVGVTIYPSLYSSHGTLWDLNHTYEIKKRFDPIRYMAVKDAGLWLKNNADPDSGVVISKFASHHGLAFYSNLRTYTFEYYPGIYMPIYENNGNYRAKAIWKNPMSISDLIIKRDIDYVVNIDAKGQDVKSVLLELKKGNIIFTSVYHNSYKVPEWYGNSDLNITIYKVQRNEKELRFITIGDPHIKTHRADGGNERLKRIVNFVNNMTGDRYIDFVVLMGDITDRGTDDENDIAKNILKNLTKPYYVVAGNHDISTSEDNFRINYGPMKHIETINGYQLLFVGIFNRKDENGSVVKLGWSFNFTKINKQISTLVFLHGAVRGPPPECTSCEWTKDFFRYGQSMQPELDKFNGLLGVYSGHVHYDSDQEFNRTRYITINGLIAKDAGNISAIPSDKIGYTLIKDGKINYSLISY